MMMVITLVVARLEVMVLAFKSDIIIVARVGKIMMMMVMMMMMMMITLLFILVLSTLLVLILVSAEKVQCIVITEANGGDVSINSGSRVVLIG